jgi:hypothetical protein
MFEHYSLAYVGLLCELSYATQLDPEEELPSALLGASKS